ncbi:MAG: N-acetylmuramoyl-L-alanine amidase, partial [Candidatus Rokuibacteriota bacterium]
WLVPGDVLVKALPALVGAGVHVSVTPGAPAPPRPVSTVSLPPPHQDPPSPRLGSAAPPRPEPAVADAAGRRRGRPPSVVELRHQTYPTHTRVVLEGAVPADPQPLETAEGLVVPLPGLTGPRPQTARTVRDGLIATLELTEAQGEAVLRVVFERAPGSRKVSRLESPPRLVLDFHRVSASAPAVPAAAPQPSVGPSPPEAPPAGWSDASRAGPPERGPTPEPTPSGGSEPEIGEPPPAAPVKVGRVELRYRSYPTYTRVVLEGPGPLEPRLVESGGALVVPLSGVRGPSPRAVRAVRDGLVAALELTESRGQAALRVTFERAPAGRKAYRLQDPPRLVLDFYRAASASPAAPERAALQTIVIDAGHGGHDPGAGGSGGLQEKEITLDIARRLAALIQEELGVRAVLTRPRDQFVPLRERTAFANRQKADLFVSIHVNAAPGVTATGTETYFLSSEATDNAARAAAAFENKVIALEPGPRSGSRDVLRSILWDLAQSEFQQESSRLAEALQDHLERALRQPSRGVKQAPFYVLGGAAMPAVLVEIGFLSNPHEEQRLRDDGYRDRIARALAAGLAAYKRHHDQKNGVLVQR